MLPFFDPSVCHWRYPGDVALALSYPVLWNRMRVVGINGVSTDTQVLHLLTFFFRYVCYPTDFNISIYNSLFKTWYLCASTLTVVYLLYMQRGSHTFKWTRVIFSATSLVLFVSAVIASILSAASYRVISTMRGVDLWDNYLAIILFEPVLWNMSQLIAVGAMIPQLVMLYKEAASGNVVSSSDGGLKQAVCFVASIDTWMWTYVFSFAAFRTFYIPHWIWRYNKDGFMFIQPLPQICAVLQLAIIYGFVLTIVVKNKRTMAASGACGPVGDGVKIATPLRSEENGDTKAPLPSIVITDIA